MFAIIGLGNIGFKYRNTRHNAGFNTVDIIAKKYSIKFKENAPCEAKIAVSKDDSFILVKPQTFMNNSGAAVKKVMNKFNLSLVDLIVIYDDVDIPVGKIRIREKGSAGTHNGMKSIIASINSGDFIRIRVGISKDENSDLAKYVLSKPKGEENKELKECFELSAEAAVDIMQNGINSAMVKYNNNK